MGGSEITYFDASGNILAYANTGYEHGQSYTDASGTAQTKLIFSSLIQKESRLVTCILMSMARTPTSQ